MNEISNAGASAQNVLDSLKFQPQRKEEELGKTAFLELMIAQLENQDPLSPQDNTAFVTQLAQFSQVEGVQNLNQSMQGMALAMRSTTALQASTLVGRTVRVPTEIAPFDGVNPVPGVAVLPSATSNLNVHVVSANGEVIRTMRLGVQPGGEARFSWDGRNELGEPQAAGRYRFVAEGKFEGDAAPRVELAANVDSVSVSPNGDIVLNVAGVGPVSMGDVKEIR